jgi:hypothetical protein
MKIKKEFFFHLNLNTNKNFLELWNMRWKMKAFRFEFVFKEKHFFDFVWLLRWKIRTKKKCEMSITKQISIFNDFLILSLSLSLTFLLFFSSVILLSSSSTLSLFRHDDLTQLELPSFFNNSILLLIATNKNEWRLWNDDKTMNHLKNCEIFSFLKVKWRRWGEQEEMKKKSVKIKSNSIQV